MKKYITYKDSIEQLKNSVPTHWNIHRAKGVFDSIDVRSEDGSERLLSVSEHKGVVPRNEMKITMFMAESYEGYKLCEIGDLVINSLWAWGRGIGVSEYNGIVSTAYGVFRPKNNKQFNPTYLNYLLRTKDYIGLYFMRSKGIWISRLILQDKNFLDLPIIVPPKKEQDEIVQHIKAQEEKINQFIKKKQRFIELLKEQRQSIINQAVTKGQGKWISRRLKFIADLKFSNVDKHTIEDEISVRLCNYVDVYKNDYITNDMELMNATATESEIEKFKVLKGDVIFTKDSEEASDIAVPAFVKEDLENVVCGYHLGLIRADETQVLSEFLFRAFQSKEINSYFEVRALGVTRVGLSLDDISSVRIAFPKSVEEQKQIVQHIKTETATIDTAIAKAEREIELIKEYKEAMISEAVMGKRKLNFAH